MAPIERFELGDEEPRLVLGWLTGSADPGRPRPIGELDVLPALAGGGPLGTQWDGPVFYEETRERAEQLAKEVAKADRASVREGKLRALFDRLDGRLERD